MKSMEKYKERWQRILALFLAVATIAGSAGLTAFASASQDAGQSGVEVAGEHSALLGESGDESQAEEIETVKIGSESDLRNFSQQVNEGTLFTDKLVVLEKDIILTGLWTPIGVDISSPFRGSFDGQGNKIVNLSVDKGQNGGLFGYVIDSRIKNIKLINPKAQYSTSGLFFSSTRTEIENCTAGMGLEDTPIMGAPRFSSYSAPWGGDLQGDQAWFTSQPATNYTISNADEFAAFAYEVNNGQTFENKTIRLLADINLANKPWIPIGVAEIWEEDATWDSGVVVQAPFSGVFDGGGYTIKGLNVDNNTIATYAPTYIPVSGYDFYAGSVNFEGYHGGLFGYLAGGSISNLIIEDATIANGDTGVLAAFSGNARISNITVINARVSGGNIGAGIINGDYEALTNGAQHEVQLSQDYPHVNGDYYYTDATMLKDLAVIDSTIEGSVSAAGITYGTESYEITGCAVYGSNIEAPSVGGIVTVGAGYNGTSASFSNNIVMNTKLLDGSQAAGAIVAYPLDNTLGAYSVVTDNIISNVTLPSMSGNATLTAGKNSSSETFRGVTRNFVTDASSDQLGFNDSFYFGNFWDSVGNYDASANPLYKNAGYDTKSLTNGEWVPNKLYWTASKNNYPHPIGIENSLNPFSKAIAAIAVVVPVPNGEENSYKKNARLLLMEQTVAGDDIHWSGLPTMLEKEDDTGGGQWNTYYLTNDDTTGLFNLTAKVDYPISVNSGSGKFEKVFTDVEIYDSILRFDKHIPQNGDVIAIDDEMQIHFTDEIKPNSAFSQFASLQIKRIDKATGAFNWVTAQTILCTNIGADADDRFTIINDKIVDLNFDINQGYEYRVVFPAAALEEKGASYKNYNDEIIFEFSTTHHYSPVIKEDIDRLVFYSSDTVSIGDLLKAFQVWETPNGTVLFDKGMGPITPTEYTLHSWDNNDPWGSAQTAAEKIPPNTIAYYLDDKALLGANRGGGEYRLFLMAQNDYKMTAIGSINIQVVPIPEWSREPMNIVHIPWTDNEEIFASAAKQGATAIAKMTTGDPSICNVIVEPNKEEWERAKDFKEEPSHVTANVYIVDTVGNKVESLKIPVTVYLDKPLFWTMAPSPVVMNKATKHQVEERMNVIARNFNNSKLIYDHWSNEYRKPGLYYIDLDSEPMHVTNCPDPNCASTGKHPANTVNDIFILQIIDPPGYEITHFWGELSKETRSSGENYSKEIFMEDPLSYTMPSYLPDTLKDQRHSRLQLNYFNKYRWGIYSDALDLTNTWNETYDLEVTTTDDKEVSSLLGSRAKNAVQFKFNHVGLLFGSVEFDWNINGTGLEDKSLGLYQHNYFTDELELISDVIVTEDGWASSVVSAIYPTTYVIAPRKDGDTIQQNRVLNVKEYLMLMKDKDESTGRLIDATPKVIAERKYEIKELYNNQSATVLDDSDSLDRKRIVLYVGLAVLVTALATMGACYLRRGRKNSEEK